MSGNPVNGHERAAHRAALDHVLALTAQASCVERLVLRGGMTMLAWVRGAREPADLDWVVRPVAAVPLDDLDPYPYVDRIDPVQHWPEAAHGAARNQLWTFEDFDTGGHRPRVPPEGLNWGAGEDTLA